MSYDPFIFVIRIWCLAVSAHLPAWPKSRLFARSSALPHLQSPTEPAERFTMHIPDGLSKPFDLCRSLCRRRQRLVPLYGA